MTEGKEESVAKIRYCWFFLRDGGCRNGAECPFLHDMEPGAVIRLQERMREKRLLRMISKRAKLRALPPVEEVPPEVVVEVKRKKKKEWVWREKPVPPHILSHGKTTLCVMDLSSYCYHFLAGGCPNGPRCEFLHQYPPVFL
jgi:hypothetical protein